MNDLTTLLAQHGLSAVFVNVLLTQIGVPLPAMPMLIVAGALAAQGHIGLLPLAVATVAASLIGDSAWYIAGKRYGRRVLKTLCRIAIEPDSCVKQTENIFERWGAPSLMVAKYVPGFSTVAPPLAGMVRLGLPRFFAYSTVAALLWGALPIGLGMVFHAQVDFAIEWIESAGAGALAVIGGALLLYVSAKFIERYLLIRFLRSVRIGVDDLRALMAQSVPLVILDARSAAERRLDPRRMPGAIAVDMAAPQSALHAVAPDRDVIVYCS
ncbi:MAG TPA: VTT domain-containing protein [Burkholderiales bacterium]|jgi:membrane protein DedA with SNARE-associated domain|nr:VTT domain-containing protein [Burkholderiales bacterium]